MRGADTPILELLASFTRSRHDLRPSTLRGYEAGVRRFSATHAHLRDLVADNVNDYIGGATARRRRFLAHHDGRSLRVFGCGGILTPASGSSRRMRASTSQAENTRSERPSWCARNRRRLAVAPPM